VSCTLKAKHPGHTSLNMGPRGDGSTSFRLKREDGGWLLLCTDQGLPPSTPANRVHPCLAGLFTTIPKMTHACIDTRRTCAWTDTCGCVYSHSQAQTHQHTHTCTHTHTHTRTRIMCTVHRAPCTARTHTHTHTHTHREREADTPQKQTIFSHTSALHTAHNKRRV
jgi:hypothetical protein